MNNTTYQALRWGGAFGGSFVFYLLTGDGSEALIVLLLLIFGIKRK